MKRVTLIILLALLYGVSLSAQKIEKYFDYNWKECPANMARFYSLTEKTDSGWLRRDYFIIEKKLQMKGLYQDSSCKIAHGHFYYFHANGIISSVGEYVNKKRQGLWLSFHNNGVMKDSTVFEEDQPKGISLSWHANGFQSDSSFYYQDGAAVRVSRFEDGTVSSAGRLNAQKQLHGKWQFFHTNGNLSASETYNNGMLINRQYYSEDGKAQQDTTDKTGPPVFKGGVPAWTKYLEKQLYFPDNYKIVNGDKAVVVVSFTINENGKVTDVYLPTPFHPVFNDIVLRVIRTSPIWQPAMNHNRRVRYTHRQLVGFNQITY